MPTSRIAHKLVWMLVAVAVLAAACGNDDDPALTAAADATPTPTAAPQDTTDSDTSTDTSTEQPTVDDGVQPADVAEDAAATDGEPDEVIVPGGGEAVPTPTQAPISGDPAFTTASKLSTVGLDEIFFGDPVDEAATKVGTEWIGLPPPGSSPQCYTVQPGGGPAGIVLTVLNGRIERIDITNPDITTRSGAGVGSTQAQLFDLFGDRLEETELATGSDIMFVPTDADDQDFRIIWTTDGLATVKMRAGRLPGVLTDSPCG